MKLIKFVLLLSPLFLFSLNRKNAIDWVTRSSFSSQNISFSGEKPQSYKLIIDLVDENYTQTYTLNEGKFQINVKVYGKAEYLSCNNLSQITCQYKAIIVSDEKTLTGNFDFQAKSTIIGNKVKSKVEKDYKDFIIRKLIKEIEQI